jgi:6-phosphogluconate dehydrogenase
MKEKADIGMIGLAVMGENLALNMEGKGFTVAVYNRTVPNVEEGVVERFIQGRGRGKNFIGCESLEKFVRSLSTATRISPIQSVAQNISNQKECFLSEPACPAEKKALSLVRQLCRAVHPLHGRM